MRERWRKVVGYEDYYLVSTHGRVYRKRRRTRDGRVLRGRYLKPWLRAGYWCTGLTDSSMKQKFISVHVLVATAFLPNPKCKPHVNHRDGDKTNCVLTNLEWVTRKENAQHASFIGLLADKKGENHHLVKLTDSDVTTIRVMYTTGSYSQRELARLFRVGQSAISRVVNGKRWSHIPQENR